MSFVDQPGSQHGPDLLVTNSDGTVAVVPGIGSGGTGSGFFAVPNTRSVAVRGTPLGPVSNGLLPTTAGIFQVNTATLQASLVFAATDLTAFDAEANGQVVAGFADGEVELLSSNGAGELAASLVFHEAGLTDPSSLQLVPDDGEIFATNAGQDRVFAFSLSEGIAVLETQSPVESRGLSSEVTPLSEAGLFLVASFVPETEASSSAGESFGSPGGTAVSSGPAAPTDLAAAFAVLLVAGAGEQDTTSDTGSGTVGSERLLAPSGPLGDFIMGVDDNLHNLRDEIRQKRIGDDGKEVVPPPAKPHGSVGSRLTAAREPAAARLVVAAEQGIAPALAPLPSGDEPPAAPLNETADLAFALPRTRRVGEDVVLALALAGGLISWRGWPFIEDYPRRSSFAAIHSGSRPKESQ